MTTTPASNPSGAPGTVAASKWLALTAMMFAVARQKVIRSSLVKSSNMVDLSLSSSLRMALGTCRRVVSC